MVPWSPGLPVSQSPSPPVPQSPSPPVSQSPSLPVPDMFDREHFSHSRSASRPRRLANLTVSSIRNESSPDCLVRHISSWIGSLVIGEPWKMAAGGEVEAEYDVPDRCMVFRGQALPVDAVQRITGDRLAALRLAGGLRRLGPNESDRPLFPQPRRQCDPAPGGLSDAGTLTTTVQMTRVSQSGGMIIQHYDFAVHRAEEIVYSAIPTSVFSRRKLWKIR